MNLFHFATLILHNPAIHCSISPNFTLYLPSIAGIQVLPHQTHGARPAADGIKTLFLMPDAGNSAAPYR
jgi:hypothetical protein